jgi:type I restriction enzyme S subunit
MSISAEKTVNLGPHPQYPKSVKAGIPKLLDLKVGWKKRSIGELFDVVTRPVDMQDETVYNLVTVKRSRGGVIRREKLQGKKIAVKSQFYVEAGDFLISKRQIVHGACGYVPAELSGSIVSNEYSVLQCKDKILPEFLSYLMHTPYFQQTCFHSSLGIHVEKMIFKLTDWFKWDVFIPSKVEQKEIANFLSSVDDKLNKLHRQSELLEIYKRGVVQKIFKQEIRFKRDDGSNFPDWEEKELAGVLDYEQPTKYLVASKDYDDSYATPVLTAGKTFILGYTDERNGIFKSDLPVIIFDDFTTATKYVDFPFKAKSSAMKILKSKDNKTQVKVIYEFMKLLKFPLGEHKRYWISEYSLMAVPYPHPDEQKKISNFIATIDNKLKAVNKKLIQLETFKKGLLQKMFI